MSKATMTVEGFAVAPRKNQTPNGNRVVSVRVAHSWSKKLESGGYENVGGTTWAEASFWNADADHVASRVQKGTYVTLSGDPEVQTYDGRDGVGVTVILRNPTIGIDDRRSRTEGSRQQPGTAPAQTGGQQGQGAWSQPGTFDDETPF